MEQMHMLLDATLLADVSHLDRFDDRKNVSHLLSKRRCQSQSEIIKWRPAKLAFFYMIPDPNH